MITDEIAKTSNADVKIKFVDLLSSLSALRSLTSLDFQAVNESFLIRNALKVLIQYQDMESCSVFLRYEDELVNVSGLDWDDISDFEESDQGIKRTSKRFKIGEGLIGLAAETRVQQHSQNCMIDSRFKDGFTDSDQIAPGSLICTPIDVGHELIGVLNVSHPQANFFNEWHERMLMIYCSMMGHLIVNRRLFHDMEDLVAQRTSELKTALQQTEDLKKRYEQLSLLDELTGLFNRRYFFSRAESAISNALRYGQSLCVLLIDLDAFKLINDKFGHTVGDSVVKNVAVILNAESREGDIVARFGGDEFVVVLPNTPCSNGVASAERIINEVRALTVEDVPEVKLTVSIGLSCVDSDYESDPPRSITVNQLIQQADLALYKAKSNGKNSVVTFIHDL